MKSMIELENISKDIKSIHILDHINMEVEKASIHGLIGNNGAGKTTLIRCILGLYRVRSGNIKLLGENPYYMRESTKKKVGVIFDQPCLIEELDALDNLSYFESYYNMSSHEVKKGYKTYADILNFHPREKQKVSSYSKGMKQKLAIIRAILHEPELLVLDEPFSGLDPRSQIELKYMIQYLNEKGTTIFISSHNLSQLESMVTNVTMIEKGKVIKQGSLDELIGNKGHQYRIKVPKDSIEKIVQDLYRLEEVQVQQIEKDDILIQVSNRIGENLLAYLNEHKIQVLECTSNISHLETLFSNNEEDDEHETKLNFN